MSEPAGRPPPQLPALPAPRGDYVPAVVHDGLAVSSGMTPRVDGELVLSGVVGRDVDVDQAREAAGLAARNALAAIGHTAGGLDRIERCLRLTVFVACTDGFEALSAIADGASAALTDHLGAAGLPARSAIGVRALPSGAPVEVELTAAVRAGPNLTPTSTPTPAPAAAPPARPTEV